MDEEVVDVSMGEQVAQRGGIHELMRRVYRMSMMWDGVYEATAPPSVGIGEGLLGVSIVAEMEGTDSTVLHEVE